MPTRSYAIRVVWKNGEEEYVCEGLTAVPARFRSYGEAMEQRNFIEIGLEDYQSINVVHYPKTARKSPARLADANRASKI